MIDSESLTYLFIWLREKGCPFEIKDLIMQFIKNPVAIIFNNEVLKNQKTFTLYRTYSEGIWIPEESPWDWSIEYLVKHSWQGRRDMTNANQIKGLSRYWRYKQKESGEIARGQKVPLWWIRKPEPFYIVGNKSFVQFNEVDTVGFGEPDIVWGSGIDRASYLDFIKQTFSKKRISKIMREAKEVDNPIIHIIDSINGNYNLYMVGETNQRNFNRRIEEASSRCITEVEFRKNACFHTLLGCTCCNLLEPQEHHRFRDDYNYTKTMSFIDKSYKEFISYGIRKKARKEK